MPQDEGSARTLTKSESRIYRYEKTAGFRSALSDLMRNNYVRFITSLPLVCLVASCSAFSQNLQALGGPPMCEASTVVWIACDESKEGCLLVGDNEQGRELYQFPLRKGVVVDSIGSPKIKLNLEPSKDGKPKKIEDIEAIARYSDEEILVFGSHSRDSKCEKDSSRRKFARISLSLGEEEFNDRISTGKISCEKLFGKGPYSDDMIAAVCAVIDNSEAAADEVELEYKGETLDEAQAKLKCNSIDSYNAEGLIVISGDSKSSVWVGLRAPVLSQYPSQSDKKNFAILLHMPDITKYRFDSVALLDMDGRGVREIARNGEEVWVIAGPSSDKDEDFQLRSFKLNELQGGNIISTTLFKEPLPASSEGLAIVATKGYVVIDGDWGEEKDFNKCVKPSGYITLQDIGLSD